jgi:hypothetical protein
VQIGCVAEKGTRYERKGQERGGAGEGGHGLQASTTGEAAMACEARWGRANGREKNGRGEPVAGGPDNESNNN